MENTIPQIYQVGLSWEGDGYGVFSSKLKPSFIGGPSVEFDGREDWWSPKHLLMASINLSFMTTFMSLAKRVHLKPESFNSSIEGKLLKTPTGWQFAPIVIRVNVLTQPQHKDEVTKLLELAKERCIIVNHLNVQVEYIFQVSIPKRFSLVA